MVWPSEILGCKCKEVDWGPLIVVAPPIPPDMQWNYSLRLTILGFGRLHCRYHRTLPQISIMIFSVILMLFLAESHVFWIATVLDLQSAMQSTSHIRHVNQNSFTNNKFQYKGITYNVTSGIDRLNRSKVLLFLFWKNHFNCLFASAN